MVGAVGFELTTTWSQTRCATRLRYAPTKSVFYSVVGAIVGVGSISCFDTDTHC